MTIPPLIEIVRHDDFVLFERADKRGNGWRSYHLIRSTPGPKRNWWFSCNSERFCDNRDMRLLAEHEPAIYRWLTTLLVRQ